MEFAVGTRAGEAVRFIPRRLDTHALRAWALALAVILYLAFNSGGYALQTHAQVGIALWWIVTICAAWQLLPVARLSRGALLTVGLFAAFTAWTALGITWSISSGRSFQDLALVSCYLGVLVLAVSIHRERNDAVRHTLGAVASAIVIVAALAVAARLWPHLFPGSQHAAQMPNHAGSVQPRLSWPLDYWNALASLMTIGLPLLLGLATSARTLRAQAAAAAAIPLLALCAALTQSRGGLIAGAVAVIVFIALAPARVEKLGTWLLAAGGSAALVAGGLDRVAIRQGLTSAAEHHQATVMALAIVLVCGGVAVAQLGLGLLVRHATLPALLRPSVRRARALLALGLGTLVVVALAVHVPSRLHHAWESFKSTSRALSTGATHFSATSGEGRYQFWTAGVDSARAHPLTGSGPGTFQLDWLPRAHIDAYVTNAHSLYVETYAELGLIGLALLVAFLLAALTLLVRQVIASDGVERTRAAAVAAALCAFAVGSASDWFWQMPVIPVAILLLLGACLVAPAGAANARRRLRGRAPKPHWAMHVSVVIAG
ncbi:MAG: O-antigen ligase family protein, partial [Solirubrobacteraceae bacterium]